ncbi:MAG: outer-membrane lipoprotein carrier protein LolA [Halioglobus sp.]
MKKYVMALCCAMASLWANADTDATEQLLQALKPMQSLEGRFEQRQYDQNQVLIAQSRGVFKLLRPGYFYWEIESPGSQLIVATNEYIWHHDRDLETVTRRPVDNSEQMSPLQVLGGDENLLRESFTVTRVSASSYSLTPNGINPGFSSLVVTFNGVRFNDLEIIDNLNQKVVISFTYPEAQTTLTDRDFLFTPPEGADLFYYD